MARLLVAWLVLLAAFALAQQARADDQSGRRIALVIGNSAYQHVGALANPKNDAAAMARLFRDAGFATVEAKSDLGVAEFRHALADFQVLAAEADIAAVYDSGHGIEVDGHNFLIPVDASVRRIVDVQDEAVPLERVLDAVSSAHKLKLVILDACRADPFGVTAQHRAVNRGFARVEPNEANELIAYSAKAGTVAADGDPGGNSPFTAALLKRLVTPGLDVELALREVRDDVLQATNREQEPFYYGSMGGPQVPLVPAPVDKYGPFSDLVPKKPQTSPTDKGEGSPPTPQPSVAPDEIAWSLIKGTTDAKLIVGLRARFPDSALQPVWRAEEQRLAALAPAAPTAVSGGDQGAMSYEEFTGRKPASSTTPPTAEAEVDRPQARPDPQAPSTPTAPPARPKAIDKPKPDQLAKLVNESEPEDAPKPPSKPKAETPNETHRVFDPNSIAKAMEDDGGISFSDATGYPAPSNEPPARRPGAQPPAAPASAVSRAALLTETPGDPQKPKVVAGTAVWTLLPPGAGPARAAGPAVQAEIDIPEAKLHATATFRKNIDPSLSATHTIDLRFGLADGAELKGFKDMALPQMRRDDTPTGDPLLGVRVKINDAYFIVGLTRADADTARNIDLLTSRNWLDFPLLFNDDHVAKLTFEKGPIGQSVIAQAIEAWSLGSSATASSSPKVTPPSLSLPQIGMSEEPWSTYGVLPTPSQASNGKAKATYISTVYGMVMAHVHFPKGVHSGPSRLEGTIVFNVDSMGGVTQRTIVHPSGSDALDAAAYEAIGKAQPFPRPPNGAPIGLRFSYGAK